MRLVPEPGRSAAPPFRLVRGRSAARGGDARELVAALDRTPIELPPWLLYDARGSRLFEAITRLDEYYLTRAEIDVLERHADAILARAAVDELFELGSGSSRKTRLLIEAGLARGVRRYGALDVSETALVAAAQVLAADYPALDVEAIVGDFHRDVAGTRGRGRRLTLFLGSTIGNLRRDERSLLLARVRAGASRGDALLVGYDLAKDPGVLVAAYDDPGGLTAAFLRNGLVHFGRLAGAELPIADLRYEAVWVDPPGHMEMRFVARADVRVELPRLGRRLELPAGEHVLMEISSKFTRDGFAAELAAAGWRPEAVWADSARRYEVVLARAGAVPDA